jgi:hypothetical protein
MIQLRELKGAMQLDRGKDMSVHVSTMSQGCNKLQVTAEIYSSTR